MEQINLRLKESNDDTDINFAINFHIINFERSTDFLLLNGFAYNFDAETNELISIARPAKGTAHDITQLSENIAYIEFYEFKYAISNKKLEAYTAKVGSKLVATPVEVDVDMLFKSEAHKKLALIEFYEQYDGKPPSSPKVRENDFLEFINNSGTYYTHKATQPLHNGYTALTQRLHSLYTPQELAHTQMFFFKIMDTKQGKRGVYYATEPKGEKTDYVPSRIPLEHLPEGNYKTYPIYAKYLPEHYSRKEAWDIIRKNRQLANAIVTSRYVYYPLNMVIIKYHTIWYNHFDTKDKPASIYLHRQKDDSIFNRSFIRKFQVGNEILPVAAPEKFCEVFLCTQRVRFQLLIIEILKYIFSFIFDTEDEYDDDEDENDEEDEYEPVKQNKNGRKK